MDKRKAIGAIAAAPAERKGRDLEVGEVREGVGMIGLLTLPSKIAPDFEHFLQHPGSQAAQDPEESLPLNRILGV